MKLHGQIRMRIEQGFTFFFSSNDMFSNWHIRDFVVKGITFNCGEQYMMFAKAKLFGDHEKAAEILKEPDPREQKRLGREVQGFVQAIWDEKCVQIMVAGLTQKFMQHKDMADLLVSTEGTELVEAAHNDRRWGIGVGIHDPARFDKGKWRGLNLLGQVLTKVRSYILEKRMAYESDGMSI